MFTQKAIGMTEASLLELGLQENEEELTQGQGNFRRERRSNQHLRQHGGPSRVVYSAVRGLSRRSPFGNHRDVLG